METLEMIGWLIVGFLPTLGLLELSYQMGKVTGKKGEGFLGDVVLISPPTIFLGNKR
jgi:hypothetical protein